jgi:putative salt-induced outer membrane protein YdiY
MDGEGHQFLAGAGLSQKQDCGIGLRQERNFLDDLREAGTLTYQELKVQWSFR